MSLAQAVQTAIGQPATVRIGVVVSVDPLVVNVQGALFTDVGVIPAFAPAAGSTVALLGQSAVSSDGSSWLCLGTVTSSAADALNAVAATVEEGTVYTSTSTAYATAGAPLCGVAFTAPLSGKVLIHWAADLRHNTGAASAYVGVQIAIGSTLGAGTVFEAANDTRSLENGNTGFVHAGSSRLAVSLTPGVVYNATLYHRVTSGTGSFAFRSVITVPMIA